MSNDLERRKARQEMLTGSPERRNFSADMEMRTTSDGNLKFTGYASTTETPYEVNRTTETIARGAFKRTLGERPDVVLLIEHGGLPLARTTSGTLTLTEDARGLKVDADLDPSDPDVQALVPKLERQDLTEMSFAFRATDDDWSDDRTKRTIRSLSIHRGDVSIVSRGANAATAAELTMRSAQAHGRLRHSGRAWLDVARAKRARLSRPEERYVQGQDGHPKGKYTDDEIQKLGEQDPPKALKKENGPGYHYPIKDKADLHNAIQAYGRAKPSERAGVRGWIIKRAREMRLDEELPKGWGVFVEKPGPREEDGRSQLQTAKERRDRLRGVAAPPQACKACGGTGRLNGRVCYLCLGAGRVKSFSASTGTALPGGQDGVGTGSTGGSTAI